jgi:hypothetical protein
MNVQCPTCRENLGRTLQWVDERSSRYGRLFKIQAMRSCPTCHGTGHVPAALPEGQFIADPLCPSDFSLVKGKTWRVASGHGSINGLPGFAGKAIATDGILVAIERADGSVVLGHLDTFVRERVEREGAVADQRGLSTITKRGKRVDSKAAELRRMMDIFA